MTALGIRPIDYRPWRGERTNPQYRFLVISRGLFRRSLRSKGVLIVLIFGILLAHTFPIIAAVLVPHKELTNEDMIGTEMELPGPRQHEYRLVDGEVWLNGSESLVIDGEFTINGTLFINGSFELHGSIQGMGGLTLDDNGNIVPFGMVSTVGLDKLKGELGIEGVFSGNGTLIGTDVIRGNGTFNGTVTEEEFEGITFRSSGYFTNGLFVLFVILLAAIICSDVISDDLADSSFVLYFSRPVRTLDYLAGKFMGLLMVMSIFCLVLPLLYVLVMIGTQSGNDYNGGLVILGKTFLAGLLTSIFFLPFGLLLSSLTRRKAYAGIGIFASLFVLMIIGGIFSNFDPKWTIIDPGNMLMFTYIGMFGDPLPNGIVSWELSGAMLAITVIPMVVVYWLLLRKGVGK